MYKIFFRWSAIIIRCNIQKMFSFWNAIFFIYLNLDWHRFQQIFALGRVDIQLYFRCSI